MSHSEYLKVKRHLKLTHNLYFSSKRVDMNKNSFDRLEIKEMLWIV